MTEMYFGRLVALDTDAQQQETVLNHERTTLGRLATLCDVVVNRPTVSRVHAVIERRGSYYALANLSRQQTYVNGTPVADVHILADGDAIGLDRADPSFRFFDAHETVVGSPQTGLMFDDARLQFVLNGEPLELTPNEMRLFHFLYQHTGEVCTHRMCEEAVWGQDPIIDAGALHRLVANLRAKLHAIDPAKTYIETRRGVGYLLKNT